MRPLHLIAATLLSAFSTTSLEAQWSMNAAPSTRGSTEVSLTFADSAARANTKPAAIRIDFGQPHLRGRQLHSGNLVPFDSTWRLGANDATTLTTDVALTIGGKELPRGTYVLQAVPKRAGWTLIVSRNPGTSAMQAAMSNAAANEMARISLRSTTLQSPVESLSFWLIPSSQPGPAKGELRISWGTTQLSTDWATK